MNQVVSKTINIIRFPLMLLIVVIHAYSPGDNTGFNYLQTFFSQVIARIAVPLFFIISSFLLFFNYSLNRSIIFEKLSKRVKTLLVPFLFWNLVVFGLYLLLQELPFAQKFSNSNLPVLSDLTFDEYLGFLFIHPIANQFWFIRDLMILVVLSPLIYLITKKTGILLSLIALILVSLPQLREFLEFKWPSLLFFNIGCFLALTHKSNYQYLIKGKVLGFLTLIYLIIAGFETWVYVGRQVYILFLHYLNIIIGLVIFWNIFLRAIDSRINGIFGKAGKYSFIVYAMHVPINVFVIRLSGLFLDMSFSGLVTRYLLAILLPVALSMLSGKILDKIWPGFYSLIIGNRGQ
ncbi:MAG TPA: acyltransferase [Spirochaetota bacterium]|mgnify:CR=1 FL=1|nr:acyltransferase [Spirochaetota bacterium]